MLLVCGSAGTDQRFKRLKVDGVNIGVSVWDTAGQDRFASLTPMYYRGAQGVVYGELHTLWHGWYLQQGYLSMVHMM